MQDIRIPHITATKPAVPRIPHLTERMDTPSYTHQEIAFLLLLFMLANTSPDLREAFYTNEPAPAIVDEPPSTQPTKHRPLLIMLVSLLLVLTVFFGTIATLLFIVPLFQPRTEHITLLHTFSIPQDLQGQMIAPVTITQSQSVPATGTGHQAATYAHGQITIYNGSFTPQFIPQDSILTSASGIQITTDQAVTIPAGNPPSYGQANITAHAINPGIQGNIAAYSINTACCATAVKAINTAPFIGGRNARDYHVVTTDDISHAVPTLTQAGVTKAQRALQAALTADNAFIPFPCTSAVQTNHHAGDEATSVTATVRETCAGIVYSHHSLQQKAQQLLAVSHRGKIISLQLHLLAYHVTSPQKGVTITVAIIATMCYQAVSLPHG